MSSSSGRSDNDKKEKKYQETIALTQEEMRLLFSNPEDLEEESSSLDETALNSRDEGYQSTVAMTPEEMGVLFPKSGTREDGSSGLQDSLDREKGYDSTIALSKEEMGVLDRKTEPGEKPVHDATVALSKEEMGIKSSPPTYLETMALSDLEEVEEEKRQSDSGLGATEAEKVFFEQAVAKGGSGEKYRLEKKLFSGGMGAILKVTDRNLTRTSAMKVVLPAYKSSQDTLTSFVTEARITGFLEHPNIIPVHELGFDPATGVYFTMKLAHGEALNDILDKIKKGEPGYQETFSTYQLLSIFRKVADAIAFAHANEIIHQDIKPHNVVVGDYGEVLLMDWGLGRYIGDAEKETDPEKRAFLHDISLEHQAEEILIKGTPSYMAPEQTTGDCRKIDTSTDIFLLGATLYHMFTLEAPYFGDSLREVVSHARIRHLILPQHRSPERQIPEEICRIIMKAMEPEKENRYQKVEDLARDIDNLIAGRWTSQEKKDFKSGDMLMVEGDIGEEAYLIVKGSVEVFKETDDHRIVLGKLEPGDIVGEMSLIAKEARSASVEALEDTSAAILTKEVLTENLKKLPPYMEKIVSALNDRLRIANANIHPHATSDCTYVVLKHLRLLFMDRSGGKEPEKLRLPYEDVIEEIAEDIGISGQKVTNVLSKAIGENIIAWENEEIGIPSLETLIRHTRSMRKKTGML